MVVCGMVGVVEGNRFAENAREWSPRGTKIKTVFNFRSTGIFGARHGLDHKKWYAPYALRGPPRTRPPTQTCSKASWQVVLGPHTCAYTCIVAFRVCKNIL